MQLALPLSEPNEIDAPSAPPAATIEAAPAPAEEKRFNYFNYFTEIEDAFVARRGAPMIISSLDWALIESWRTQGVPLHVVLRGIAHAFAHRDATPSNPLFAIRKVNSLMYCQQAVLTEYLAHCQSQVGASTEEKSAASQAQPQTTPENEPFPTSLVVNFLEMSAGDLERMRGDIPRFANDQYPHLRLSETMSRTAERLRQLAVALSEAQETPSMEKVEQDLTILEDALFAALRSDIAPESAIAMEKEAASALKPYKKRMEAAAYQQTLDNYIARQMRMHYGIPRLSLFYLRPE